MKAPSRIDEARSATRDDRSNGRDDAKVAPSTDPTSEPRASTGRLRSLDGIRGLAIVVMLLAGNPFPRTDILDHLTHPTWHGLTFADLFFPLFLFAMGVSMTLSRRAGSPMLVLRRVVLLLVLGIFLTSLKHEHLVIVGVLQHIAGAYLIAWLVMQAPRRLQLLIAGAMVALAWVAFVLWSPPGGDPWSADDGFAHAVNSWFLGGFTTEGVPQTVISAVTVLGGAFIGRGMKGRAAQRLMPWLAGHATWLIAVGALMSIWVPINKRLWSPSFTVLTIGTSCAWLALFVLLADVRGQRWITPMEHLGANPIAVYVVFMTARALLDDFRGIWPQFAIGESYALSTTIYGFVWVALALAFAGLLYKKRLFFKI